MINEYKKEATEATDAIIMDIMDQHGEDIHEYSKDVLDWSFENIFGG